jgi:hypothetical protein
MARHFALTRPPGPRRAVGLWGLRACGLARDRYGAYPRGYGGMAGHDRPGGLPQTARRVALT